MENSQKAQKKFTFQKGSGEISGSFLVLIIVMAIATLLRGTQFLSFNNLTNIIRNNAVVGIISVGMTLVIISGGIDLSVGSAMMLDAAIIITVSNTTGSIVLGILAGLATGVIMGCINGLVITKGNVPPFIATLGMMNICRSLGQFYMNGGGLSAKDTSYRLISNSKLLGIPYPIFYLIIIALVVWYISQKMPYGRYVYAVGSNEKATKLSSINVDKVKILTYILIGVCVALAAVVESSRMNSINASSSGMSYELDAISAVVVGGTSMNGGKGNVLGTLCGVLIIGIMNNMMVLIGVQPFLVNAVKGVIVVLAVLLQKKN